MREEVLYLCMLTSFFALNSCDTIQNTPTFTVELAVPPSLLNDAIRRDFNNETLCLSMCHASDPVCLPSSKTVNVAGIGPGSHCVNVYLQKIQSITSSATPMPQDKKTDFSPSTTLWRQIYFDVSFFGEVNMRNSVDFLHQDYYCSLEQTEYVGQTEELVDSCVLDASVRDVPESRFEQSVRYRVNIVYPPPHHVLSEEEALLLALRIHVERVREEPDGRETFLQSLSLEDARTLPLVLRLSGPKSDFEVSPIAYSIDLREMIADLLSTVDVVTVLRAKGTTYYLGTHVIYLQMWDKVSNTPVSSKVSVTFERRLTPDEVLVWRGSKCDLIHTQNSSSITQATLQDSNMLTRKASQIKRKKNLRLTFVGSLTFDGQKQIWLNVFQHLKRSSLERSPLLMTKAQQNKTTDDDDPYREPIESLSSLASQSNIDITYLCFMPSPPTSDGLNGKNELAFPELLRQSGIEPIFFPLTVSIDDIADSCSHELGSVMQFALERLRRATFDVLSRSGESFFQRSHLLAVAVNPLQNKSIAISRLSCDSVGKVSTSYYWTRCLREATLQARRSIMDNLSPPWVHDLWAGFVGQIARSKLLVAAARLAGVQHVVMELPNLYPVNVPADIYLAPSEFVRCHESVTNAAATSGAEVLVIHPGTDFHERDEFSCRLQQQKYHNAMYGSSRLSRKHIDTRPVIGYVGRLSVEKSLSLLLRAMAEVVTEIPKALLVIIGEGDLKVELFDLANRLGLIANDNIRFLGGIYNDDLACHLSSMDVFVNPSQAPETFCIANVEAMAAGIPIVTFGLGGSQEYLFNNTNSVVVQRPDPSLLAEHILLLLKNETMNKRISHRAKELIRTNFSTSTYVREYEAMYWTLANTPDP